MDHGQRPIHVLKMSQVSFIEGKGATGLPWLNNQLVWVVDVFSRILSVDVFQNIDPRHLVPLRPIKLSAWLEIFFGEDVVLYPEHRCL